MAAALLLAVVGCRAEEPYSEPRLHYVTTAHQLGPVGYRDPLGVISPDGAWLAWAVQHHVYLRRIAGGAVTELLQGAGSVVHLAWTADARRLVLGRRDESPRWWAYEVATEGYTPLWPPGFTVSSSGRRLPADELRQLAFSADGRRVAGVVTSAGGHGSELWSFTMEGDSVRVVANERNLSFPAFAPDGRIGCLVSGGSRQTVGFPCGEATASPDASDASEAYGGLAFSPAGGLLYTATPNQRGTVDLWSYPASGGRGARLTHFARDAYAPSAAADGSVLFKVQTYRTHVADMPAEGGSLRQLAHFQSETPFYDPSGRWIGITYGTWRRVIDDFRYPDIAQDVGIIPADPAAPADSVTRAVDASVSEDQGMAWSPNAKWIAYHSHKEAGDDIWLVAADGSAPATRITSFGRGFETGWPRWSPDGKWVVFDADTRGSGPRRSVIWVMGMDQETGTVTMPETPIRMEEFEGDGLHAEWLAGSQRLVVHGFEEPDRHSLLEVSREGGRVRVIHRWRSEHRHSGFGLSPEGRWAVFPAPAGAVFQLFRVPVAGGTPTQLTFGPGHKTQPAYAPDGRRIALTVWEYEVQFWVLRQ